MYQYSDFDRQFVQQRAAQFRDQLERAEAGTLGGDEFKPLRLQNGWYIQRFAPMLRVAVPYGEISSAQLRVLAKIARDYDHKEDHDVSKANAALADVPSLPDRCGHFTTRQNVQYNWIPLHRAADVMDLLASVNLHGIQTSGNCIRNITTDALAGIAVDEVADPRPFSEIMRQWSTLHPEFAFLPRKFKIAITGAREDRAATPWHDVGLRLLRNVDGDLGFQVRVGGGMGRTPIIGTVVREFLPWNQILNYLEAVVRAYNRFGRRDNIYKARIKILVKAEGQAFTDQVEAEYADIIEKDGAPHTITQAELDRVSAFFVQPELRCDRKSADAKIAHILKAAAEDDVEFSRWLTQNVKPHQNPDLRAVTLSFKRLGSAPGDASADQLERAADLADRFSAGEARVTHEQNLLLPWVRCDQLPELWREARRLGLAKPNIGLLSDMIACPGGDFCDLANARSLPIAQALLARYQDLDELHDLGEIDLHISGCINSCGHHHSGHIGILGVDKDGQEWYQVTLGGSDGTRLSGEAVPGKVIGPSFAANEMTDVIEALLTTYRAERQTAETFTQTVKRVGIDPFKTAANAVRVATARTPVAA
ncbi:MAG TPA: nitrite reductase [Hydrogenophaga sp.]|jgi:sulfite reductase (NADPH) hemoprotein beta-component|uniref:nitrite/sulfite reductase n=2 Tax=Hydrogenophaga sp. TaxID=1904254 RepID=UPI0008BCBF72|nr:nitrite/sulfite reductase [Hydrogenophaga sp.]MBU4184407.1 nitrite/sulfite reductase [Gammaproteobacteria bacterium]OGA79060.1 MAG: nitrite reductase [Burkholderiales bacterium GWE1_65_30]OGA91948.1 MAG: nitrite reductase [Burkholderiales bacterium GWF1_66_17]OGB36547.1 MAG: nitrite reductase [Burkholderiales bacterium RIFCSPLOWO2_02_FULL_66_35]PKO65071.1 MAG: nitrite reductase [Betaproteobacteria bacterium HGW-Betaproteobacteria-16]